MRLRDFVLGYLVVALTIGGLELSLRLDPVVLGKNYTVANSIQGLMPPLSPQHELPDIMEESQRFSHEYSPFEDWLFDEVPTIRISKRRMIPDCPDPADLTYPWLREPCFNI